MNNPAAPLTLKLSAESASFVAACDELSALLVNAPDEFVDRLLAASDRFVDFVSLNSDGGGTAGANEVAVIIEPSDGMNRLLATARAGDFDLAAFDFLGHDSSSVGSVDRSNEDPAPGESQGSSGSLPHDSQVRS